MANGELAFVDRSASRRALHKVDAVLGVRFVEVAFARVSNLLVVRRIQGPPPIIRGVAIEGEIHASVSRF